MCWIGPAIPRVPHSQGLTATAVFEGEVGGLNPPIQSLDPQKTFYNVLRGGVDFNPPNNPIEIINAKRTTDRNFSPESQLQQSQKFQNFSRGEPPVYVRGEII